MSAHISTDDLNDDGLAIGVTGEQMEAELPVKHVENNDIMVDDGLERTNPVTSEDAVGDSDEVPRSIQIGLVTFSCLYVMFFSGAIFGWGPMQLMLEQDGAFEFQCQEDEELPCDAQSVSLVRINLIATYIQIFSPFMGIFVDHFGALASMYLLAISGTTGIALSMVASATSTDQVHYLGFSLIGVMFVASIQVIIQTGLVLPGRAQRRVISLLNNLLDLGTVAYLILYYIGEATGATFVTLMGGYLGFGFFCFGGAIFFWAALNRVALQSRRATFENAKETKKAADVDLTDRATQTRVDAEEESEVVSTMEASNNDKDSPVQQPTEEYTLIAARKPWEQLTSQLYLLLVLFFAVHLTRNNWTMATVRDFLASLGDNEVGNKYTSLFTGLSAVSVVGFPFVDMAIEKYGYHFALQMVNVLGILHGIIQVSTSNLDVQTVGFVVFSFYRCFTFSVCFAFLPTFVSGNIVGKACGVMSCGAALFSLINLGLVEWAINGLDSDFFIPNLLFLVLLLPMVFVTWKIGSCIQREEEAEKRLDDEAKHVLDKSRHSPAFKISRSCAFVYEPALAHSSIDLAEASSRSWMYHGGKQSGHFDFVVSC